MVLKQHQNHRRSRLHKENTKSFIINFFYLISRSDFHLLEYLRLKKKKKPKHYLERENFSYLELSCAE